MIRAAGKAVASGRLIGWAAVVASLGFVGLELWQYAPWQLASAHLRPLVAAIVAGAVLYGLAGFLLSTAWHQLLGATGPTGSLRWHHAVYGRTQIAKYLPGNVFHLVGRQVMGRRLGHGQARLALASLLEALLLVLVAAGLSLPIAWHWLEHGLLWVLALGGLVLAWIARRWIRRRHPELWDLLRGADRDHSQDVARLLRAACLYVGFFCIVAAIFLMLALSLGIAGWPPIELATSVSAIAFAWLAGFATPGSSAGIGVREAVLIAALEGTLGAPASALIALALRLVSIAGDVVFFAVSMALVPAGGWPMPVAGGGDLP